MRCAPAPIVRTTSADAQAIAGVSDPASVFYPADATGGLVGDPPGEMTGGCGYSHSGLGATGGTGWGTIGTGRYGTSNSGYGGGGGGSASPSSNRSAPPTGSRSPTPPGRRASP